VRATYAYDVRDIHHLERETARVYRKDLQNSWLGPERVDKNSFMSLKKSNKQNHQHHCTLPNNLQSATATEKGGLKFDR
jgi:hypothetical protein